MLQKVSSLPRRRRGQSVFGSHLKTRQLALLVAVDEERSLARAAQTTGLTQPAASKLLCQIESVLKVKLFERHPRGMVPTCYGEILIRHARLALSELGLAREEIAALVSGVSGKAAIGTVLNPGANLVPAAVARIKQRYPNIVVSIEIDHSRQLIQRLLQGRLDMVIGRVLDSDNAGELVYEPLAPDEPHAVIASFHHPLARRKDLKLEDLIDQPWILPPIGSLVRDKLAAMFVQRGLPLPTNIVETLTLPVITSLLQHSNMVVALPEQAVSPYCRARLVTVMVRNLPLGVGAFGLITRRRYTLSPGAQLMLTEIRDLAAQMYPLETGSSRSIRYTAT